MTGVTCHGFFSSVFFRLFVIIEHNLGVLSTIVLNLFVVAKARVVLKCSFFGPNIEARCSYKIVLIKKSVYLRSK